ncbi:TPA: hypothetical protein ACH3X1_006005 [Trebouxia sp. C0004]
MSGWMPTLALHTYDFLAACYRKLVCVDNTYVLKQSSSLQFSKEQKIPCAPSRGPFSAILPCDDCSSEDIFVWERNNFVHRSKAYSHMIAQCKRKRTAVTEKDKQKDFSFWRPESVVILYKREVVAALQAELDEQPFQGV